MKNLASLALFLLSVSLSARAQTERPRPSLDLALSAPLEDLRPDERQILDEAIQLIQKGDHGLALPSRFERVPLLSAWMFRAGRSLTSQIANPKVLDPSAADAILLLIISHLQWSRNFTQRPVP
jgi:hypothetical protein